MRHNREYYLRIADNILRGKRHEMYNSSGERVSAVTINDDKFKRVPIKKLIKEPEHDGCYHLYTDRWWALDDYDNLLFYDSGRYHSGYGSPQCNSYRDITRRMIDMENHPAVSIVFLERVWIPHSCIDYIM